MTTLTTLRCATWNVHRARGTDGRVDPGRIMDAIETALAPLSLDVLALQEADEETRPHRRILDVGRISAVTGLRYAQDDDQLRWGDESDGFLGTILFLSPALSLTHAEVIDLPGHCHRGAVSVEVGSGQTTVRIMSMHLSLSQALRVIQMRTIGQYMCRRPPMQTVLLGDFNEWRPWGGWMFRERVIGTQFRGPSLATFPSRRPLLPLDRILSDGGSQISLAKVVTGGRIAAASDHLPLFGEVTIAGADKISPATLASVV
ncbi:MAG: endonuclease/exonuclease/phosphatase family protein [Pseudomonadota bacterium]